MRRILTAMLLFLAGMSQAQVNYAQDAIPANLRSRANATVREDELTVDMRSPENVIITRKRTVTVHNESGEKHGMIVQGYDKNTVIKGIKGEVYNSRGIPVMKFTTSNFADESANGAETLYGDARVKYFIPNVQDYPYTITYTSEIRDKQNLILPEWMPNYYQDLSVEKSTYTFLCKPDDKLNISTQLYNGKPAESVVDKVKTLKWSVENVPAVKAEPYSPIRENAITRIRIAPVNFVYYNKKGTQGNWDDLGKWYYEALLKDKRALPAATVEEVNRLLAGVSNPKEKARKLYAYMQNKVRYISVQVGIGGFEPFPASNVDRLSYGDCKGLVNYMQSLLDIAGIPSYYCVVEAGSTKISFDERYADMAQGNHVILCLPFENDTTWLECTSQKAPFGYLGDFTDDRYVLACTPTGGKIMRTPKLSPAGNTQKRTGKFDILPDGTVKGSMETVFKGSQYQNHEEVIGKNTIDQVKALQRLYDIDHIQFDKISYKQDKSDDPATIEQLSVTAPFYAAKNEGKYFFRPNMFSVNSTIAESRNRVNPVYINRGYTDEDELVFTVPDTFEFSVPEGKKLENEFGSYITTYKKDGNKLTFSRKLTLNDGQFPAEGYNTFFNFMREVSGSDGIKLILTQKN